MSKRNLACRTVSTMPRNRASVAVGALAGVGGYPGGGLIENAPAGFLGRFGSNREHLRRGHAERAGHLRPALRTHFR